MAVIVLMRQISGFRHLLEIDATFVRNDELMNLCRDSSLLFEKLGFVVLAPLCSIFPLGGESLHVAKQSEFEFRGA